MLKYYAESSKGDIRPKNDDRVGIFSKNNNILAVLCDGMGGHQGGDFAASVVVNTLAFEFQESFDYIDTIQTKNWIGGAIEKAKLALRKAAENDYSKANMGTTLVATLIIPDSKKFFVFNSGDSRAYVYTSNLELIQITKDQNVANSLIEKGTNLELAHQLPNARHLTSALGPKISTTVKIYDFNETSYQKIEKLLLTSDGIHEFLFLNELEFLVKQDLEPEQIVKKLINQAVINQSNDNMSALVIDFNQKGEL
ncbi:PP2C family protein-serine/threonine phosphatase [Mycoplasma buteonis]|uniref:PP2C family protein-serine/threonine phosphatase n=1 Tax=Mycoplasma buteonis TaxID=171280 RepID=UPI00055D133C|nr:PP2C family serine/threonine-protein phosphatase [Mycoplasma buteonis]